VGFIPEYFTFATSWTFVGALQEALVYRPRGCGTARQGPQRLWEGPRQVEPKPPHDAISGLPEKWLSTVVHINPLAHVFDWVFFIHFGVWLTSSKVRRGSFGLGWVSWGQVKRSWGRRNQSLPRCHKGAALALTPHKLEPFSLSCYQRGLCFFELALCGGLGLRCWSNLGFQPP